MEKNKPEYDRDRWTDLDELGFDGFVPALESVLSDADTPLTVGVFGSWGTGKTTLLQMLRKNFGAREAEGFRTRTSTAKLSDCAGR